MASTLIIVFLLARNNLGKVLGKPVVGKLGDLKTKLDRNVLNAVDNVQVLAQQDLEASSTTLTRGNDGRSKEVLPDSEPSVTVGSNDLLTVAHPVSVPAVDGSRVVDTNVVNRDNLKTGTLKLISDKSKRSRSISTRGDLYCS